VLPTEELGIGFVPSVPLRPRDSDRQRIDDKTPFAKHDFHALPRFSPEGAAKGRSGADRSDRFRSPPPEWSRQLRSRWRGCWHRNPGLCRFQGATKLHRLREGLGAAAIDLNRERGNLRQIAALAGIGCTGRYPASTWRRVRANVRMTELSRGGSLHLKRGCNPAGCVRNGRARCTFSLD